MGRYRKIDPRIWNDAKFRGLSDSAKMVFLFCLTHPFMTSLGAMRATVPGMAAELGWSAEAFREAFREVLAEGLLEADESAAFVGAPNFLRYNPAESPNVVRSWGKQADLLPECELKTRLLKRVKGFAEGFGEGFDKAFGEAFPKGSPNPEPEPEPQPEQEPQPVVDHSEVEEEHAEGGEKVGHSDPVFSPITDPGWQRTIGRAARLAKKAGLPRATPEQREYWLKVSRLVELGTLPEALPADAVAGLLATENVANPWGWLYSTLRNNATEKGIDLEAALARLNIPPSVLNGKGG